MGVAQGLGFSSEYEPKPYTVRSFPFDTTAGFGRQRSRLEDALARTGSAERSQFMGQQANYLQSLQDRAAGRGGPSPAELQARQSYDQAARLAMQTAAANSGLRPGNALAMALNAGGQASTQGAQQNALLRAQEQLAASGQLGQALQSAQTLEAQRRGLGLRAQEGILSQMGGLDIQSQQARMAEEELRQQAFQAYQNALLGVATENQRARSAVTGQAIGGFAKGAGSAVQYGSSGGGGGPNTIYETNDFGNSSGRGNGTWNNNNGNTSNGGYWGTV